MILLDNNLLTDIPNFVFELPALKVLSFSGNLLLPEPQKIKPVFAPNKESFLEIIETVKITDGSGCQAHQDVGDRTGSPYEEISINDRNHIQPLKCFQSCSRCILQKYGRSEFNIENEKSKNDLQEKKQHIKFQNRNNFESINGIRKIGPESQNQERKVPMEIIKISWHLVKHSALALTCSFRLRSKLKIINFNKRKLY